ncbi:MAG TPA: class I SAM-dependent methyltransferase [Actinokineospora sp.]|nr:class I SAM-dependent methyltransferase [Actinokineospora sp.]
MRTAFLRILASQLGRPRGLFGKLVARKLNKHNLPLINAAVDKLAPGPDDVVADLGFGGGVGLALLLARAREVHGVDYSEPMVTRAALKFGLDDRLRLHVGSMTALPLPDAELDGLITLNTIYFIEDLGTAFTEIARVLRPGGRGVIGIADPAAMAEMPVVAHGFRVRPIDDVVAALAGAGLAVVDHSRVGDGDRAFHLLSVEHA